MRKSKNTALIFLPVMAFVLILSSSFKDVSHNFGPQDKFTIPTEVNTIFDKSCFGCHNSESTNEKGKEKLLIDKLPELSKAKLIAKLDGIAEVVGKNEMPPEKFLSKYPDKALTKEEAKLLKEWAESTSAELMK